LFSTTNVVNVLTGVGEPTGFTTLNDEHLTTLPQSQFVDDELFSSSFEQAIANNTAALNNSFFILIKF
jgi:ABC-type branched-subunit amino acid transport system ATPase component